MQTRVLSAEVGRADWVAFHLHRLETRPQTRTLVRTGQIAVGATGVLVMLGAALLAKPPLVFHVSLAIFVVLGVGLYPRTFRRSAETRIRRRVEAQDLGDALGAQSWTVDDQAITRRGPGGAEEAVGWERVTDVLTTDAHVLVCYDLMSAHVIRRAAFEGPADVADFVSAARARRDAAAPV